MEKDRRKAKPIEAEAESTSPAASKDAVKFDQDNDVSDYVALPPDGGWGWVIVFASFMNHFILDGIAYAFGVFMQDYADYFHSSKAQTSALMSTLLGFYMLTAPVASGLINRFGLRAVGISGSLVAGAAFALCTLSPNIECMIVLFGVLGGFGFGLMYLPAVISVGYYFDKKRAIATGIAMCGTGVGTFTFGPFGTFMLEAFDWKNAHYILAGIIFNGVVFSALIRPLKTAEDMKQEKERAALAVARNKAGRDKEPLVVITDERGDNSSPYSNAKEMTSCVRSTPSLNTTRLDVPHRDDHAGFARSTTAISTSGCAGKGTNGISISDINRPMYRKDIFYSGSVQHLPEFTNSQRNMKQYIASITNIPAAQNAVDAKKTCCSCLPRAVSEVLANMLDLSLFKDKNFLVISISCLFTMVAYLIPFGFTNVRAMSLGIGKDEASFLISLLGITNMFGRVAASAVAQIPGLKALFIHNVSIGAASLFILAMPLSTTYATIAVCAGGYGFFIGGHVSLCPIFLCDLLGLERLTTAYGLLTLVRGIAVLVGPTLAGGLSDMTGNYDLAFYMGGSMMAFGTFLFCLLHLPYFSSRGFSAAASTSATRAS